MKNYYIPLFIIYVIIIYSILMLVVGTVHIFAGQPDSMLNAAGVFFSGVGAIITPITAYAIYKNWGKQSNQIMFKELALAPKQLLFSLKWEFENEFCETVDNLMSLISSNPKKASSHIIYFEKEIKKLHSIIDLQDLDKKIKELASMTDNSQVLTVYENFIKKLNDYQYEFKSINVIPNSADFTITLDMSTPQKIKSLPDLEKSHRTNFLNSLSELLSLVNQYILFK